MSPWRHAIACRSETMVCRSVTNKLLFSTIVNLMSVVVCRIRPSIHAAFQARAETVGATIDAVYDKLDGIETAVSATRVHTVAARLAPVIDAMKGARTDGLPGYRTRILDGNHLPGSEHRIQELRTLPPGPCPVRRWSCSTPGGCWPPTWSCVKTVLRRNGRCWTRSWRSSRREDLWIADRNFCTTDFLFGIALAAGRS